jgi:hypothetical protein
LRDELESIRNKAMGEIGPQDGAAASRQVRMASAKRAINQPMMAPAAQAPTQPQPQAQPGRGQSWDMHFPGGGGSSPVGPLGVLFSIFLMHRKNKKR